MSIHIPKVFVLGALVVSIAVCFRQDAADIVKGLRSDAKLQVATIGANRKHAEASEEKMMRIKERSKTRLEKELSAETLNAANRSTPHARRAWDALRKSFQDHVFTMGPEMYWGDPVIPMSRVPDLARVVMALMDTFVVEPCDDDEDDESGGHACVPGVPPKLSWEKLMSNSKVMEALETGSIWQAQVTEPNRLSWSFRSADESDPNVYSVQLICDSSQPSYLMAFFDFDKSVDGSRPAEHRFGDGCEEETGCLYGESASWCTM